jgi:exopolyphosphatase/pppGpp-phosphohydrolase
VILAGAVIAEEAARRVGLKEVTVSEHDLLDGVVLALASPEV